MPWTIKSPSPCWLALSTYLGMPSIFWHFTPALAFTSCLLWDSGSARDKRLGPSLVFYEHAYSPAHACGLLDSLEYIKAVQNSQWGFILLLFLFSFLVSFLFAPTDILTSGSYDVKQLLLIVFSKCPMEKAVWTEKAVRSNKYNLCKWGISKELPNR